MSTKSASHTVITELKSIFFGLELIAYKLVSAPQLALIITGEERLVYALSPPHTQFYKSPSCSPFCQTLAFSY